jgi:hypothetical protein
MIVRLLKEMKFFVLFSLLKIRAVTLLYKLFLLKFNLYTPNYFTHMSNNISTHHVLYLKIHDVSHSLNNVTTYY